MRQWKIINTSVHSINEHFDKSSYSYKIFRCELNSHKSRDYQIHLFKVWFQLINHKSEVRELKLFANKQIRTRSKTHFKVFELFSEYLSIKRFYAINPLHFFDNNSFCCAIEALYYLLASFQFAKLKRKNLRCRTWVFPLYFYLLDSKSICEFLSIYSQLKASKQQGEHCEIYSIVVHSAS